MGGSNVSPPPDPPPAPEPVNQADATKAASKAGRAVRRRARSVKEDTILTSAQGLESLVGKQRGRRLIRS